MSNEDDASNQAREQDRFLPIANISRIMKKALPNNAKIAKDAKETVQECVSEFISFITSEASDKCQREKRKTINGDDLLWAMTTLGFEEYIEPLKAYLQKYREAAAAKQQGLPIPNTTEIKKESMPSQSTMSAPMMQQPPMHMPPHLPPMPPGMPQHMMPFPMMPQGMMPPPFPGMAFPPGLQGMIPTGMPPPPPKPK